MFIDPLQLILFIPAALALNLTPGSDMMFCLGTGLKSGPRAGIFASLGVATGALIHSLLAAFGLAALLAAYPIAFEAVRWAGVGYLVWLAIQAFRKRGSLMVSAKVDASGNVKAWRDGAIVNLFNPKVAIFILAFVPQFVDPAKGSTILQFLIFGLILNIGGTIINGLVGGFAGSIGKLLITYRTINRLFAYLTCFVFLGLAARLAISER